MAELGRNNPELWDGLRGHDGLVRSLLYQRYQRGQLPNSSSELLHGTCYQLARTAQSFWAVATWTMENPDTRLPEQMEFIIRVSHFALMRRASGCSSSCEICTGKRHTQHTCCSHLRDRHTRSCSIVFRNSVRVIALRLQRHSSGISVCDFCRGRKAVRDNDNQGR